MIQKLLVNIAKKEIQI